ncbi:MAG: hypothetical protein CMJ83_12920 [Planctomycetes bacterium]|nr:hypothetical protein [Planctomycetota bacterium]
MKATILPIVVMVAVLGSAAVAQQDESLPDDPAVLEVIDTALAAPNGPREHANDVWRAAMLRYGTTESVVKLLEKRLTASKDDRAKVLALLRLQARLLRTHGDLRAAQRVLRKIEEKEENVADTLAKAETFDALGQNDKAIAGYGRLLEKTLPDDFKNRILLRKALMQKSKAGTEGPTPLAKFALEDGRSDEQKNQAAIILALSNEQKDALKLYQVHGEGTKLFQQEIRLAEWAIEAGEWKPAQDHSWKAVRAARMKRDRRYGLTILVEAYRRADELEGLIERLAKAAELDDQSRQVWIDLLRETGKVEDALRLFRESSAGTFTNDMRRQLLEMCRETGQEATLVAEYQKLIKAEPRFIEWREGLARNRLERGDRPGALAVWNDYLDVTEEARYRMAAAASLMKLGLDDRAMAVARSCMDKEALARDGALLFLFELHKDRGRLEDAETVLEELGKVSDPKAGVRMELADAYARLGNKKRAAEILQGLKDARGDQSSPDAEMKLAVLYSEIGEEEKAQAMWVSLWRKVQSIPRRRYVEDRMMTVAARLGTLAKIAVELESKLADGKADDRDAGLLVQLYSRVNDAVSATEIIEEHMRQSGKKPADVLQEKARIFLACNDYYNYEQVVWKLVEIDPDGRPDYLRQLAMSILERGQREEARKILTRLKSEDADTASDEFEAGVLSLAGMRKEALAAYRKGLARHPDRIDTWLLLSNIQKELGEHDLSAGMFQHLAATAEKDDLFTIAVDGILNMRDGRQNRGAPDRIVEWTRRVVLERLASRPNKLYLWQLVADLSDELKDKGMAIRALKASLPIAGEQRTPLLRELMTKAKKGGNRSMGIMRVIVIGPGGQIISQSRGGAANETREDDRLMYGRRLLGQGELVPPGVYLELGEAFLGAGEVVNAARTFNAASQLPEFDELQRKIAAAFETARYPKQALRVYERILTVETTDIALMSKVGQLHEQLDRDELAAELYERGMNLLMARKTFSKTIKKEEDGPKDPYQAYYRGRNIDADTQQYHPLLQGLLTTLPAGQADRWLLEQKELIDADFTRLSRETKPDEARSEAFPRLKERTALFRRVAVAFDRLADADAMDTAVLRAFPKDEKLLEEFVRFRRMWGYVVAARRLIDQSQRPDKEKGRLRLLLGGGRKDDLPARIAIAEASGLILPLLIADQKETVGALLERLDLSASNKDDLPHLPLLVTTARYLDQSETALSLLRYWLSTVVTHQKGGSLWSPLQQILTSGRRVLDKDQRTSLTESLVQMVVDKPDKFSTFIQRLPELKKQIGADLLTLEQVQKLIKSRLESTDRFIYGVPQLFVFIPPESRGETLRGVWTKIAKGQRAQFVMELMQQFEDEIDEAFGTYLASSFRQAIKDVENKDTLVYYAENLTSGDKIKNAKVVIRIYDALLERDEKNATYLAGKALCLLELDRKDEAVKLAVKTWKELITSSSKDYHVTNAVNRISIKFGKEHREELLLAVDELEKKGKNPELTRRRLALMTGEENQDERLAALKKAVVDHEDDAGFKNQLRFALYARGLRVEAAAAQEKLVESKPDNANYRRTLESDWRWLRNPARALAARHLGKKPEKKTQSKKTDPGEKHPRMPAATVQEIKKSLDRGDEAAARVFFRRLWRSFPRGGGGRSVHIIRHYVGGRFVGRSSSPLWPEDEKKKKPKTPKKKVKRHRGGWTDILDKKIETKKKKEAQPPAEKKPKRLTMHEVLAKLGFGEAEMRRQLRTLDPGTIQSGANPVVQALTEIEAERYGREEHIAALLAKDRAGTAGKLEYAMLFTLLESSAKEKQTGIEDTLESLIKNVDAKDTGRLRRLARLYAKLGDQQKAATMYLWVATMGGGGYIDQLLLNEVIDNLEGDARERCVVAILEAGRPDDENYWDSGNYENIVLNTWVRLIGPDRTMEKAKAILDELAGTPTGNTPPRAAAKTAAWLLARSGRIDEAVRCMEVSICKLTPPESASFRYPWLRNNWTNFGYAGDHDWRRLMPKDTSDFKNVQAWYTKLAEATATWLEAERVAKPTAYRMLAILSVRLYESGRKEEAAKVFERVTRLAGKNADNLLLVADVARRIGNPEHGDDLERGLLDQARLHPERVPEVVARIYEREGAVAALAAGEKAAIGTPHPDLLDTLIRASRDVLDPARAAHWAGVKDLQAAAEVALRQPVTKK